MCQLSLRSSNLFDCLFLSGDVIAVCLRVKTVHLYFYYSFQLRLSLYKLNMNEHSINSSEERVDINNDIEQNTGKNNTLFSEYKPLKFQWISQDQTEGHCAQLEIASRALLKALEHISSEHFSENNFCRVYA